MGASCISTTFNYVVVLVFERKEDVLLITLENENYILQLHKAQYNKKQVWMHTVLVRLKLHK